MKMIGFDMEKYTSLMVKAISERISKFGDRLYLEVGGKLFDDMHASRILPGFEPDAKIKILEVLRKDLEVILCISAKDIVNKKTRSDNELSYASEVIRQISLFRSRLLNISSIVITLYENQEEVDEFRKLLIARGENVVVHSKTKGYPTDVNTIVSEEGYGKNPYVPVTKPIVVVTAPGPGSGKLATCLSQLYYENKNGRKAGYSKLETFPVYDLELTHPVNVAYEAATLDLNDKNMIDPFHFYATGQMAINYNRDVEAFPLLRRIFQKLGGGGLIFRSPTEMGINFVGESITDQELVKKAARTEILRRYMNARVDFLQGKVDKDLVERAKQLCDNVGISELDRKVIKVVRDKFAKINVPIAAIDLGQGEIVSGRQTDELSCAASTLLNAIKILSNIPDQKKLIPQDKLLPVLKLKQEILNAQNPRLDIEDCLLALFSNIEDPIINKALSNVEKLRGCEFHSSFILEPRDRVILKKLRINVTSDPIFYNEV